MQYVIDIIKNYDILINFILIILVIILLIVQLLNRIEMNRLEKRYRKMMKGTTGKNIEDLINEYSGKVEESLSKTDKIEENYKDIDTRLRECIQKVSIVRYRAFDDVGSDLSFSIALLDDKNNGFVITGIYGRSECTTFAKPVENGISKYDLSEEEKSAIKGAINKK